MYRFCIPGQVGRVELDSLATQQPLQSQSAQQKGTLDYYWRLGKRVLSPLLDPSVGLGGAEGGEVLSGQQSSGGKCRLSFWDLGGQSDLQSIWASYYAECHAIVFMIDSTDKERLERDVGEVFSMYQRYIHVI
jgi:GTPase SAR1 family protein